LNKSGALPLDYFMGNRHDPALRRLAENSGEFDVGMLLLAICRPARCPPTEGSWLLSPTSKAAVSG